MKMGLEGISGVLVPYGYKNELIVPEDEVEKFLKIGDRTQFANALESFGNRKFDLQVRFKIVGNNGRKLEFVGPFLHYLASYALGRYAMIKKVIKLGFDVNIQSKSGVTPLMIAAQYKNVDLIHLLLKYGARSDLCMDDGTTVLNIVDEDEQNHDAWLSMIKNKTMVKDFINKLVSSTDSVSDLLFDSVKNGWRLVSKEILACKIDVNKPDVDGNCALMHAFDQDIAYCLLHHDANIHSKNRAGRFVLEELEHRKRQGQEGVAGVILVIKNFLRFAIVKRFVKKLKKWSPSYTKEVISTHFDDSKASNVASEYYQLSMFGDKILKRIGHYVVE